MDEDFTIKIIIFYYIQTKNSNILCYFDINHTFKPIIC